MKSCKAQLPDGKPCDNQADEGQEYCPYHLAEQITLPKKILSVALPVLGVVASAVVAAVLQQFLGSSKRDDE
ncbi:MAG TPA: hypothetical protein VJ987_02290 [Anaerolineales bacterium]|nr:hypothetical protein [Anaerolineales bacterium]